MKFTAKTYYSLVACTELVSNFGKGPVKAAAIAEKHEIPTRFLEVNLSVLKSAGIVQSKRGAEGGYYLQQNPDDITILKIVTALEGDISVIDCDKLNESGQCMFGEYMGGLRAVIENYLKNTTLRQLSDSVKEPGVLNYII